MRSHLQPGGREGGALHYVGLKQKNPRDQCGQSHKCFTIVNDDSRVELTVKLPIYKIGLSVVNLTNVLQL